MKRRAGCIWIAAGIVLALIAGVVAFMLVLRASAATPVVPKTPEVTVVVASRSIAVRELIQPADVEARTAPADVVPESALRSVDQAVGLLPLVPLAPGEMIMASHLISPTVKGEHIAFTMDKTKVAMAFPADDLLSRNNLLKPGDRVDVLFSIEVKARTEGSGGLVTFNALQNLEVAAVVQAQDLGEKAESTLKSERPLAIVFALDPQDALVLKHLRDMGGTVDIVLRTAEAKERFDTQPVNVNYLIDRYQIRIPVLP